jgi:hypothetical protein
LNKRFYKKEMNLYASRGCREKKNLPTAISMQLFGAKTILNFSKNILASALKSYITYS